MNTRQKRLKKAHNIKRNNLSRMTRIRDGHYEARDQGLAYVTVTNKNAGMFIGFMKQYYV